MPATVAAEVAPDDIVNYFNNTYAYATEDSDGAHVEIAIVNDSDIELRRTKFKGPNVHYFDSPPEVLKSKDYCHCEAWESKEGGEKSVAEDTIEYVGAGTDKVICQIFFRWGGWNGEMKFDINIDTHWYLKGYRLVYRSFGTRGAFQFLVAIRKLKFPPGLQDEIRPMNRGIIGSPAAVTLNRATYCFYQGDDKTLRYVECNENSGHVDAARTNKDTQSSNIKASSSPSAAALGDTIYVFYQAETEHKLHYVEFNPSRGSWGSAKSVDGATLVESPAAVAFDGKIHVVHQAAANDRSLYHTIFDVQKGTWSADTQIPKAQCVDSPSLVVYNQKLLCFHQVVSPPGFLASIEYDGKTWRDYKSIVDTRLRSRPSAAVCHDVLYVFHRSFTTGLIYCNAYREGQQVQQGWEGDGDLGKGISTDIGPGVAATRDRIWCFYTSGGSGSVKQLNFHHIYVV